MSRYRVVVYVNNVRLRLYGVEAESELAALGATLERVEKTLTARISDSGDEPDEFFVVRSRDPAEIRREVERLISEDRVPSDMLADLVYQFGNHIHHAEGEEDTVSMTMEERRELEPEPPALPSGRE